MTREEAIRILTDECNHEKHHLTEKNRSNEYYVYAQKYVDAIDIAIKALEQADVLNKIREEIEQLPTYRIYIDTDNFKKNAIAIVDKYIAESEEEE